MAEFNCKPKYLAESTDNTNVTSSANDGLAISLYVKFGKALPALILERFFRHCRVVASSDDSYETIPKNSNLGLTKKLHYQ